ncbi:hypothetical protein MCOR27_003205 [Pyricularia oryzae]|uniref:Protein kinase domain-containing protein n=1 Tax=Pyricularia grisea TaxID=148305 RepID=A0ABQ8NDP9_PYRGI|nr:hypothetical protein MCOR01_004792 [Pyricularia oryzae]KAI6295370.1 hypothetical protein MCOR33_007713 [Pyricularia grisea]KAI6256559.1 hypothetical protein MCOR19_006998 [Pyricularia oryzae]KAI6283463.1 hypothetical protein MCOR27_003205 [Pyricularia oryzae]KAI6335236.1 hypothetical protein MCOR29_000392 [Pyricularia oryzae]
MSTPSNQNEYWVIFYQDARRWMHMFHSSLRSGKSFQAQVVVRYVGGSQLTGEPCVRKRPGEKHDQDGRRALRDEAANLASLEQDLKEKGLSLGAAHIAELLLKTSKDDPDSVESSYWKLYNLGSLHGLLLKLRDNNASRSILPAMAARVARHMLIAIKSSLVTPKGGLLHNDIVSSNVFVHFPPGGDDKLPDFYLGDWGDSQPENRPRQRFNGVQESLKRLDGILNEITQLHAADPTVHHQLSTVLGRVFTGAPANDPELATFLAERLNKAVETAARLEKDALDAAAGSIDSVKAVLKSFVIVPRPARYRTAEEAEAVVEANHLRGCTLQLVENGKIDFTKGVVPGGSDSSSASESSLADLVGDFAGL